MTEQSPLPPDARPVLTQRHAHGEAFKLMWYACRECPARIRIWNSRDGVTPFGMCCPSCGGGGMLHVDWKLDEYAPLHKLLDYQYFWRDGTPDEAEASMRARIEHFRPNYSTTPEHEAELIAAARAGSDDSGFRKGWPMLDVHKARA